MIGNDIVDLELASQESNWKRKGFLKKVFTLAEQDLIAVSSNPQQEVWLLWSMKEAAYKAHQREYHLPRNLNWLVHECKLTSTLSNTALGEVRIGSCGYKTTSEITSEYIYTSAEKCQDPGLQNAIFRSSSFTVKQQLIIDVCSFLKLDQKGFKIQKDELGMPFLSKDNCFFFDRFSLSGHGKFYAYSLSLINCETSVKQS